MDGLRFTSTGRVVAALAIGAGVAAAVIALDSVDSTRSGSSLRKRGRALANLANREYSEYIRFR